MISAALSSRSNGVSFGVSPRFNSLRMSSTCEGSNTPRVFLFLGTRMIASFQGGWGVSAMFADSRRRPFLPADD
jgi:hypothetical protein